ncbi:hypothetical protein [Lacrimispora sp.]|uniref:hypothetical protein n=1 Tax=Lacrimispora sp. TaxID=2719234 RepID=UPI0028A62859|nr:hypothetical protein [Lacrimispora sp.]
MKLNKGDCIKYDECIYIVMAVVWNTIYLQKVNDNRKDYRFTMEQLHDEGYRDVEIL